MNELAKVDWLRKIFSNDSQVRYGAMVEDIPQPLFESGEALREAIDLMEAQNE